MGDIVRQFRFVVAVALLALLAAFAIQNMATVELTFLHWTFESRRIVVIGVSFLTGLIIGALFVYGARRRR
jgi:uncharacterized integral membrane protein